MNYDVLPVIWRFERIGDISYFWDMSHNAFFSYDGDVVRNVRLKCTERRKIYMENSLYNGVYRKGRKIYFSPNKADYALIFNSEDYTENYITYPSELQDYIKRNDINTLFTKIIFADEYAYYVGCEIPCVLILDLNTEEFINSIFFDVKDFSFFKDASIDNDTLYIVEAEHNRAIILYKDCKYKVRLFDGIRKGFSSICQCDSKLFLIPRYDEPIIMWDIYEDSTMIILNYPEGFSFAGDGNREIAFSTYIDRKIYMYPAFASDVIYYDIDNKSICIDNKISEFLRNEKTEIINQNVNKCIFLEKQGNEMIIQNGYNLCLIFYDYFKQEIKKVDLSFDEEENVLFKKLKMKRLIEGNEIINENEDFSLYSFINLITD